MKTKQMLLRREILQKIHDAYKHQRIPLRIIAEKLNVTQATVFRYIHGRIKDPSYQKIKDLVDVFEIDLTKRKERS